MTRQTPPERADFYDDDQAAFFGDHAARYEFASHYVRGKRVVDAACGSGYGSARLKQAEALACIGIDINAESVDRNRRLYGPQGIEFIHADCETHDLAKYSPDVVVSFETIEHIKNPSHFLDRVRTGLGEDGLFIVSCPNDEKLGENPFHLHSWDYFSFKSMLEEHFREVVVLGQVETPSARVHYEFGRYLDDRVGVLWNQPWTRAWRALRIVLGRSPVTPRPKWAGFVPGPSDWWFVPEVEDQAKMLLGICKFPRTI